MRSSPGTTTRGSGPSSTSSTRNPRPANGTPPPISTGRSRLIPTRRSTSSSNSRWIRPTWRIPIRRSTRGATRNGVSSVSSRPSGASASSCTVSRARCFAPPKSSRPFRGSMPSTTPLSRPSTRPATSRPSPGISTKSSTVVTRSTRTCVCCSTTSSTTPTGI